LYTPQELTVMAWMQDQDVQGSQDNPEAAQKIWTQFSDSF
jgi:hypothetical protein